MRLCHRILPLILFTAVWFLAGISAAAEPVWYGTEGDVHIGFETQGDTVRVFLKNESPYTGIAATVTLEGALTNMTADNPFPHTAVVRGTQPFLAATLTVSDKKLPWDHSVFYYRRLGSRDARHDPQTPYALPFKTGESYRVVQGFNGRTTHTGEFAYAVDWGMPEGTEVCAMREGYVLQTEDSFSEGGFSDEFRNKGNYVLIQHEDGTVADYQHFKYRGVTVKAGDKVKTGDVIGYSGNTGYSSEAHLHVQAGRPLDGKRFETLPIIFLIKGAGTQSRETAAPLENRMYFRPEDGRKEASLPLGYESTVLCRGVENNTPVGITDVFSPKDTVYVFIPILRPAVYTIKVLIKKNSGGASPFISQWKTESGWRYSYAFQDLSSIPGPEGGWTAEVYCDTALIRSLAFAVR